jgi:hypothetical protein
VERENRSNDISGNVLGHAVQAGSIHGDVHLHMAPHETPRHADHHCPPEGWNALPDLPAEVQSLMRAQVQAAQELPYRLPGARRPSLATVYVRQDLGTGVEEPQADQLRPTPTLDDHGQLVDLPSAPVVRLAVRPPARTVREALDGDDHLLVTGGPGQGKSTLSLRLAADIATQWTSEDHSKPPLTEPVVPLRLIARELAARLVLPFSQALAGSVGTEYGALLSFPVDAHVFGDRVSGCRWLLLVDGLDEVADSTARDRLVKVLAAWVSDGSPYRVVLTTRPIEGAALAPLQRIGASRYELQPFDEEALCRFAENWFDDTPENAHRFIVQIRKAHLDELVQVPLLATIAAIIFEGHSDRPLPDNQYELYESYLKYLRSAHATVPGPFDRSRDRILEHLGLVRLETDTSLVSAARTWADQHLAPSGDWQEELTVFLAAVGPLTRRGDDLRFLHHSFAEHLAATAKARLLPGQFDPKHDDFARLLHAACLKERGRHARAVLLHHTRLHPAEADHLVRFLHTGNSDQHLLAARLLAKHVPASTEVAGAFMVTVRAWAMTTQHPSRDILAQASRATHHPGLAGWLADLMRDENTPWQSQVEAATVLATRLRGADSAKAVAQLRAVVDDATAPVGHRLAAAEALSECGSTERETSERGLRSVLTDPSASALSCRNAAVVLAGFGTDARAHAIAVLSRLLDDPCTPDGDLVEAATGLVEIGVEFHDRCAEVFRTVLGRRRASARTNRRDAAIGLASLGPEHLTEAVTALTTVMTDPRLGRFDRVYAADALAELGPQHRFAAGQHLLAMSAEPGIEPAERWNCAASLARFGREFQQHAVPLLRTVLADRTASTTDLLLAARTLADLGPDYYVEAARELQRVATHSLASGHDRTIALAKLAALGEPHRTSAVAGLRADLADRALTPGSRCQVAGALVQLGPEFHSEVAEHLLEIASGQVDLDVRVTAWRSLMSLGKEFRRRALMALLDLMGTHEADDTDSKVRFVASDAEDPEAAAATLAEVLGDPMRSGRARMDAAQSLANLGPRFHRTAVDGAVELLRSDVVPDHDLHFWLYDFLDLGAGPCGELAEALRAMTLDPHSTAERIWEAARVLDKLDHGRDPSLTSALQAVISDDSASAHVRCRAAIALARAAPEQISNAVAVLLRVDDGTFTDSGQYLVDYLVLLGADVTPRIRALLSDENVGRDVREAAASALPRVRPDLVGEAVAELRQQATDEFLEFLWRTDAIRQLTVLDPDTLDRAIAYHQTVLDDESEPIRYRCEAAYQLVQLDHSLGQAALTALRRLITSLELISEERAVTVTWLSQLSPMRTTELSRSVLAVVHDPATTSSVRRELVTQLSGKTRRHVERTLLADRALPIGQRVSGMDTGECRALLADTEIAIRDVLYAVETSPAERVAAAAALAQLSPRFIQEAAGVLEDLSESHYCAANDAKVELAKLRRDWHLRVLADAQRIVDDETQPWRERGNAANLIWNHTSNPPESVVNHLRNLLHDKRTSDQIRLKTMYMLRRLDGLDGVRAIRDDERARPATRKEAATLLRDHTVSDRAAGARVLNVIATDPTCRAALRWRAAQDLTGFGARGRELGVAALQAITTDDTLPVIVRAAAARVLGEIRPDLRGEVIRFLRTLRTTAKPLQRKHVFQAIGRFDAAEGALALRAMAEDRELGPVVRVRCAEAMAELRQDYREPAAVVVREVAHDETVARHVRARAARNLAQWSELCLAEARELLAQYQGGAKPPWRPR